MTPLSVRDAFLFPEEAAEGNIRRAKKVCESCPMLKRCARDALYSGSDLRREALAPANGVIMAGVLCDGSTGALDALEAVAGIEGIYPGRKRPYIEFGTPCRNCGTPMVRWSRFQPPIPEGFAMHRGRGLCANCRGAYAEELAALRAASPEQSARTDYSGKVADRKRTSVSALAGKIETAVKHGDEELADELRYRWSVERDREEVRKAVAKGKDVVTLPHRGGKTDELLIEWQKDPERTIYEVAALCECSPALASRSRSMLITAEVPGFAELKARFEPEAERAWRIKYAKAELNRLARKRRRKAALTLLRDRPDLSQNQISKLIGIDRHTVRALAVEHGIPIRSPGRPVPTASSSGDD